MNYSVILFLLLPYLLNQCHAETAPVCTGVSFNMTVSRQSDNVAVFIYSADISLSIADNIHTIVTLANHTYWSLNDSIYYQFEPSQYYDGWHNIMLKCPSMTEICNLTVYDGAGSYEIPLSLNNQTLYPIFTDFLVFDQGTIYNEDGTLFDPTIMPCSWSEEEVIVGPPYNTHFNYCCSAYVDVDIPDSEPSSCTEFDGNTTLYTKDGQIISTFSADYTLDPAGINITVTSFTSAVDGASFELIPNDAIGWGCGGKLNCTYYLNVNPQYYHDYQFDMMLSVFDSSNTYGVTIGGKILRRNGILVRHRDQAYTPDDPCWIRNYPLDNGGKALNSFCCTNFQSSKAANVETKSNKNKPKFLNSLKKKYRNQLIDRKRPF